MEEPEEKESLLTRLKYYTTLTLGTTACLSSFIFMFLIPWILDPSISTLMANFDPEPVVCMTVQSDQRRGMKNCSWSSCKHGCTTEQFECDQIYVNYMHFPWAKYDASNFDNEDNLWVGVGVPIFVNIKACGYPPKINCSVFGDRHGRENDVFPCYYSRVDPNMVITSYDWNNEVTSIVLALLVPNVLCGLSLGIVSYWWYPGCQKRRCQYQIPPDQEDASSNQQDGEDDDEDDDDDENEYDEGEGYDKGSLGRRQEGDMKNKQQEEEKDRDTSIYLPEE
ncbi:protein tipE-like [Macrobrachium rosenbergii]|uniref:protein tipE-like n=1 Tax=Macrobrachium rosenbergii TaxID=79674 RepID=UPI0034D3D96C